MWIMTFKDFSESIKFKYCQPVDAPYMLEIMNTDFPPGEVEEKELERLGAVTKMSTHAIGAIINKAVKDMPEEQVYLNVGTFHGYSLFAGMVGNPEKICVGVDNFSEFGGHGRMYFYHVFNSIKSDKHEFIESEFRDYFKNFKDKKIGVYFYDAAHDLESQVEGLKLAEPFMAEGALILVDDWNVELPRMGTRKFIEESEYEWETIFEKYTSDNGHPCWWNGIAAFKKLGRKTNAVNK
jgi:predicted O-methyltransferase YrrM